MAKGSVLSDLQLGRGEGRVGISFPKPVYLYLLQSLSQANGECYAHHDKQRLKRRELLFKKTRNMQEKTIIGCVSNHIGYPVTTETARICESHFSGLSNVGKLHEDYSAAYYT